MEPTSAAECYYIGSYCTSLSEWKDWATIVGTVTAVAIGIIGLVKVFYEIHRLHGQRKKEIDERERAALLKRTEFFLGQHRRLFDTPDLFEVLCLIDSRESQKLAQEDMWDKKRKFLTFFEEMALLVNNGMIDEHVADYMFSYYAITAWNNRDFQEGIDPSAAHWGLLFHYIEGAERRRRSSGTPPPEKLRL